MSPFLFFVIIVVVIWVLSAIASAQSKQKQQQRRVEFREMMEQSPTAQPHAYRPPPPPMQPQFQQPRRELNTGYGVRHPEMMTPAPQMARQVPAAMRAPAAPQRRQTPQRSQQRPQQRPIRAPRGMTGRATSAHLPPPPPIPVLEVDDPPHAPMAVLPPARATTSGAKPQGTHGVTAPAISRWLKPSTLRQQFVLTEIFQPPLAMREDRFE